ncbi:MAG: HEAT repeat domain-containing protein [Planctomycetota bacterium]
MLFVLLGGGEDPAGALGGEFGESARSGSEPGALPSVPGANSPGAHAPRESEAAGAGAGSGAVELPPLPGGGRLDPRHAAGGAPVKPGVTQPKTAWTKLRARIAELQAMGPDALNHLPELIAALHHEDGVARQRAAVLLAQLGDTGVQKLLEVLSTDEGDARLAAAFGLARAIDKIGGEDLERHAYTLADALTHWLLYPEAQVRADGAEALGRIGLRAKHTINNLLDLLQDDSWAVRRAAARSLGQVGARIEAVGPLTERLNDPAEAVRREAIDSLGMMGPDAAEAVPGLIAALDNEKWLLKSEAARALGRIGAAAEVAITKLQALLDESEQPSVRAEAATALGLLQAGGSRDKLMQAAKDNDPTVAEGAIRALGALGNLDSLAEQLLVEKSASRSLAIRMAAAEALGRAPLHHSGLRREGAWNGRVGKRESLLAAARHAHASVREAAIFAIGRSSGGDEERLAALKAALRDSEPAVRAAAIQGLSRMGAAGAQLLAEALNSDHQAEYSVALVAFRHAGAGAAAAVPALRRMLRDPSGVKRHRALAAMRYIGPEAAAALPDLLPFLDHAPSRAAAAEAIAGLGPAAASARPTLESLHAKLRKQMDATDRTDTRTLADLSQQLGALQRALSAIGR